MKRFNAKKETENIIKFIQDYFKNNNLKGVVLGISGGKDSAIVAGLFSKAIGSENVLGVTLPCHSKDSDKNDAKLVSDKYGFELINIDLTNTYDSFISEINKLGDFTNQELLNSNINIKPRFRMASVYYLAALYSNLKGGTYIVAGTSNKCELYVGYFTKGGDSVSDIAPIAEYTVSEVIAMGEELGVPKEVLYKTPSDGLSNMSDEDKLGVTYAEIETTMNGGSIKSASLEKIRKLHDGSRHKFNTPTCKREKS